MHGRPKITRYRNKDKQFGGKGSSACPPFKPGTGGVNKEPLKVPTSPIATVMVLWVLGLSPPGNFH